MQALANPLQQQTLNQPAQHKISHYYALLRISVSTVLGREGETEEETDKKTDGHRMDRQTDCEDKPRERQTVTKDILR
jgi:hypothetical protein